MWNGNNPVAYSDPTGFLIKFSTQQAKKDYDAEEAYFEQIGDMEAYSEMNNLETNVSFTVTLSEDNNLSDQGDQFTWGAPPSSGSGAATTRAVSSAPNGHIDWNPYLAIKNYDGKGNAMSPAINLLHEVTHATDYVTDPQRYLHDMSETNGAGSYGNLEDMRVMTGVEARALKALGLPPRVNHGEGTICEASSLVGGCP